MRPYITKLSHRPGCTCCNSKYLHHHRPPHGEAASAKVAKRAGKKAVRRNGKLEVQTQLTD